MSGSKNRFGEKSFRCGPFLYSLVLDLLLRPRVPPSADVVVYLLNGLLRENGSRHDLTRSVPSRSLVLAESDGR